MKDGGHISTEEVAGMVERHYDDDEASQQINTIDTMSHFVRPHVKFIDCVVCHAYYRRDPTPIRMYQHFCRVMSCST